VDKVVGQGLGAGNMQPHQFAIDAAVGRWRSLSTGESPLSIETGALWQSGLQVRWSAG
jgi:hypothetical protein